MIHVSDRLLVILSNLLAQAIRIVTAMVLLRIVSKEDYGKVGLVILAVSFFASFGDFGLRRLLISDRSWPEEELRDTVFVLLIAVSIVLFLINVTCGWFLAWKYADTIYFWIALPLGVTSVLSAIHDAQLGALNRQLVFTAEVRQQLIIAVALAGTGLSFAFADYGPFALVMQPLVAQLIGNVTILRYAPMRWPRKYSRVVARSLLWPAGQLGASYYFAVNSMSLQKLFVFLGLGKAGLAVFDRFIQVRELVSGHAVNAFDRLLLPLFSHNQNELERLRDLFLRGAATMTVLVTFGGWGLFVTAPELVNVLAGPQWRTDPYVLPAMCLPLLTIFAAGETSRLLASALNKAKVWMGYFLLILLLTGIAGICIPNDRFLVLSVAFSIVQIVASATILIWALWKLGLPLRELMLKLLVPLTVGIASGGVTLIAKTYLLPANPEWLRLFLTGGMFTALYLALAWQFDRETISELRRLIRRRPAAVIEEPLSAP